MTKTKALTTIAAGLPMMAMAQDGGTAPQGYAWIAAGLSIGLAVAVGTYSQSRASAAALEGMSRNPSAAKAMFTPFLLSLALMEGAILFALIIAFLLVQK